MSVKSFVRGAATALLGGLVLAGCGGGGGGGGYGTLDGNWQFWLNVTGDEIGPYPVYLIQNGGAIDGANLSGTISGGSFQVTYPGFLGLNLTLSGVVTGNTASGILAITGLPITGTFRMQSMQPDGSMVASGTVAGSAANFNATTAVGGREYSDINKTQLTEVEVSYGDGTIFLELAFSAAGLGVGTLVVGTDIQVEVGYVTDLAQWDVTATGGTLTITRYDGMGIAGTYSIQTPGGSTVTGSFDVDWNYEAYEP
jgi:hypothetical protein